MSSGIWQNRNKTHLQLVWLWYRYSLISLESEMSFYWSIIISTPMAKLMFFIFWFIFNLGQLSYISQWKGAGLWSKLAFWGKRLDSPAWQSWLESELLALGEMSIWLQIWDMESANNRLPKRLLASMRSLQHFTSQWRKRSQIGHRFQIIFSPPQSIGKVSSSKWFFKSMASKFI